MSQTGPWDRSGREQTAWESPASGVLRHRPCCQSALGLFASVAFPLMFPASPHWASLVAQMVKYPPAIQETLVRFMGREDPLEKG